MSSDPLQSLFVLGSSHHEAPLAVRERFALAPEPAAELQGALLQLPGLLECLVLSTCNRFEIYGLTDGSLGERELRERLCALREIDPGLFDAHSFWRTNLDAIQHALEVAAGLQSQMVGETEILGQMKQTFAEARARRATGSVLNRLFEKSFQAAKSARSQTGITRGQVSIGNVAVDLADRIFGALEDSRVLLIGSGEVGEKTAQALRSRGAGDISVTSRTFDKAHRLAHGLGGAAIDFVDFKAQLHHYDILICATAAPGVLLDPTTIRAALKPRPARPLFLIDLALPRDVAPAVERIDNVYLYNLDDLSAIANENLELRRSEIDRARAILKGHAWTLWLQLRRRTLPAVLSER